MKKADPTSQTLKVAVSFEYTKSQPTNPHNVFNNTPAFLHLVSTTYTQAKTKEGPISQTFKVLFQPQIYTNSMIHLHLSMFFNNIHD